jgi:aldose 1-epimerase
LTIVHTLKAGAFEIDVMPALGGSVTRFGQHRAEGFRHWFRPATPEAMAAASGQQAACFPLVPVSGRIAEARLRFQGRMYEAPRNVPSERNHLHGEGWQASWSVIEASPDSIALGLCGPVAGWPFPYDAALRYAACPEGLALLWQFRLAGVDEEFLTVRASPRWRPCE